jgi:hypothetical protein
VTSDGTHLEYEHGKRNEVYGIKQVKWKQPFDHFLYMAAQKRDNDHFFISHSSFKYNLSTQRSSNTMREPIYGNDILYYDFDQMNLTTGIGLFASTRQSLKNTRLENSSLSK